MPVQDWNPPEFAAPPQKLIPANRVQMEAQGPTSHGVNVPKIIRHESSSLPVESIPSRTATLLRRADFQLGDAFALPYPSGRQEAEPDARVATAAPVVPEIAVAPPPPPPPRKTEATIREDEARKWEERLQLATAQAFEEGYRKGCLDTESALNGPLETLSAHYEQAIQGVQGALDSQIALLEPLAARFALDLAERLLGIPLPDSARLPSLDTLHALLQGVRSAAFREVYVHPDTLSAMVAAGMAETLKVHFPDVRISPRTDLQPGDWILETPETAIRFLRQELLDDLKRKLGLVHLSE